MGECHTLKLERPETRCHKVGGEVLEGVLSRTCWKHSERCCPALKVQQSSLDVNTAVRETGICQQQQHRTAHIMAGGHLLMAPGY